MWILKDRWDLPHASCFKQVVGVKGSWSLGYKFGTNSRCTIFNMLVCFDAEEKTPYVPLLLWVWLWNLVSQSEALLAYLHIFI